MTPRETDSRLDVAVIGASGYGGIELTRLLCQHPKVRISLLTSEQYAGKPVDEAIPSLYGQGLPAFEPLQLETIATKADFFFLALPPGSAAEPAGRLVQMGKRVVDLSADYRLHDPAEYARWYRRPHPLPHLLSQAVYGLAEVHREAIRSASLVANPGCYPVAAILALKPLLESRLVRADLPILIDAKSGVSGAGRSPALAYHFPEVQEGLAAYGLAGHRHLPELIQEFSFVSQTRLRVTFVPHLVPINRGILCAAYCQLDTPMDTGTVLELYRRAYKDEPFIRVLDPDQSPNPHAVRGTNFCQVSTRVDTGTGTAIVLSAIDNLVKGAAGQAIQNMNLMMGWDETTGLRMPAVYP